MTEKKVVMVLSLLLVIVLGILAVRVYDSVDIQQEQTTIKRQVNRLRLGLNMPSSTALYAAAERFAQQVNQKSQGRLKVTVHPNQTLGNDNQMLEMARRGKLAMLLTPTSKLTISVPAMQVLDLPFFFPSKQSVYKALDGHFGQTLLRKLQSIGLVGITFWENGFKHFTANRPLHSPTDFQGLTFRIMKSRILQAQFETLGATALPIDFHATYKALVDGVVDGQENPLAAIVAMKFHQVQSHLTLSNHAFLGYAFSFSQQRLDELSFEQQQIIINSARDITQWQREETLKREVAFLQTIKQSGVTVHQLTSQERTAFIAAVNHMPWELESIIGVDVVSAAQETITLDSLDSLPSQTTQPILIGINSDLSMHSAFAGLGIKQGAHLAIHEINATGGVLGRPLQLMAKDHQNNGQRGRDNIRQFASIKNLAAIIGGKRSPVIADERDLIQQLRIPYLIPWAAAADLTTLNEPDNFLFRVSLNDKTAASLLVDATLQRSKKLALVLENTIWGKRNHKQMLEHLTQSNIHPVKTLYFHVNQESFDPIVQDLLLSGTESMILVGNSQDSMRFLNQLFPVIPAIKVVTHWGILGRQISQDSINLLADKKVVFPQTLFLAPPTTDKGRQIMQRYQDHFQANPHDLMFAGSGFAHAYDLVHLLVMAIKQAGNLDRNAIRVALENLPAYDGLVKQYHKPFTSQRHDALEYTDYHLARFKTHSGIVPIHDWSQ